MEKTYIGIDNGVTGTIGVISKGYDFLHKTPVKKEQSFTKAKQNITRIDYKLLSIMIDLYSSDSIAIIEQPMINPNKFKASLSAVRALEATLICLESHKIPHMYICAKQWQKELLPKGLKAKELKKASRDIGCRLFPNQTEFICKHDADALLIAEYARRNNL